MWNLYDTYIYTLWSSWVSTSDNAKLTSLVVVRALWPHDTLRMSGSVGVTVLYHMRLVRADSCV